MHPCEPILEGQISFRATCEGSAQKPFHPFRYVSPEGDDSSSEGNFFFFISSCWFKFTGLFFVVDFGLVQVVYLPVKMVRWMESASLALRRMHPPQGQPTVFHQPAPSSARRLHCLQPQRRYIRSGWNRASCRRSLHLHHHHCLLHSSFQFLRPR